MCYSIYKFQYYKELAKNKRGSALLITLLILTSILAVAFGAANLVVSGIKMSGAQERSTAAYFAAEAGAERVLWEIHYNSFAGCNGGEYVDFDSMSCVAGSAAQNLSNNSSYVVYYKEVAPLAITSTGSFANVKRIVELGF